MPDAPKQNFFAKLLPWNTTINFDELCEYLSRSSLVSAFVGVPVGAVAGTTLSGVVKKEDVNMNLNQLRAKADCESNVFQDTRQVS